MPLSMFPIAAFDRIEDAEANAALETWGHYLGANDRPFGRQSFGLFVHGELAAVAVSASTVSATCAGLNRFELIELARIAAHPSDRWSTRVMLRFWRQLAPACWLADSSYSQHWKTIRARVSYSNETRHKGDIYRFDGWRKVAVMKGSTGGGTYSSKQPREDKALWIYPPEAA